MNHRTARVWQDILLFGGAIIGLVGILAFESTAAGMVGIGLMVLSFIVWWMYFRCPECHEQLGRGNPKRCPHCGAWLGSESEPEPEKKKIQHKKKRR